MAGSRRSVSQLSRATGLDLATFQCRSNNLPGYTQGGSNGVPILADFAVKYHNEAQALGVDVQELYTALNSDGQVNPPEWNTQGTTVLHSPWTSV